MNDGIAVIEFVIDETRDPARFAQEVAEALRLEGVLRPGEAVVQPDGTLLECTPTTTKSEVEHLVTEFKFDPSYLYPNWDDIKLDGGIFRDIINGTKEFEATAKITKEDFERFLGTFDKSKPPTLSGTPKKEASSG